MYLDFEELVMLFIMIFPMCLISYGLIALVKNMLARCKAQVKTESGKLNLLIKKDILDSLKLLFGAQVVCLLFYITPAINENVKILLSLVLTLGSFVATFLIKEKKGYNNICRGLIFVGQEFFGITMLLMMINKGMGYSVTVVFALWTLFNFYIMKEFSKLENKMFFWITLIGFVGLLLGNYIDDISSIFAVVIIAVSLLLIHIFSKKESTRKNLVSNILFVLMFIASFVAIEDTFESPFIMFAITLVFAIAIAFSKVVEGKLNIKSLLLYIPFCVMLLLIGFETEVMVFISLFNIIVAANIASPKSITKKVMSLIFVLALTDYVAYEAQVDELISSLIYFCSVVFVFTSLLSPSKKVEITEGGDDNE